MVQETAFDVMLSELRRLGCNRDEPCSVHAEPQWTCGFCLYHVLVDIERRRDSEIVIVGTCRFGSPHYCPNCDNSFTALKPVAAPETKTL